MHDQAIFWYGMGQYDNASALIRETVNLRESVLGPEHIETTLSRNELEKWQALAEFEGEETLDETMDIDGDDGNSN